ncbi:hypothetical protein A2W32_01185 [candidate division WWE3 bacterium RBG_16_37_10]|uniref:Deoxynucleoside kinase domain-containing protein n=1 Tax=candidate division WWE3 bacterium RBG_16_37_10 TaxID=1802610 RepID=A0A1F4UUW5_UNCKA|nr:MAG: hypothetical protein A2W32_01185 [candidate division WWE3 bacterium RBG_16_37_10]
MKYLITTCCKEKRTDKKILPAIDRYLDPRIKHVLNISKVSNSGFVILSGKYGILEPEEQIPYYDKILTEEEVDEMVKKVTIQLKKLDISELIVYGLDKNTFHSWRPYYSVLEKACALLNIPYSEKIIVTPKIFALVGDFGSGKTSLRREFSKYDKYFIGNDLFGYLHTEDFERFDLEQDKPKAYRLNYYRDLLLESSEKELAINDEDILELLAYEFSYFVNGEKDVYASLKDILKLYRNERPCLFPIGYIDLKCQLDISDDRIYKRDISERITPEYFKSVLTNLSYRKFYNEIFKFIPYNRLLKIDTSHLSLKEVYDKTEPFVNKVLLEDYVLIDIFEYIEKLNIEMMKKEVLRTYGNSR